MPPEDLDRFIAALTADGRPHVVIGSREAEGARRIGEPRHRHAIGRVFNVIAQALAVPGINDTQCGCKLLSAGAASAIAPLLSIAGWAFDVELLYLARAAGFEVREVGITWHYRRDTRVRISRGAAAIADILRVRLNALVGRYDALFKAPRPTPPPSFLRPT
jgi:dolichyl-phosphate beta-glucosyltransferase